MSSEISKPSLSSEKALFIRWHAHVKTSESTYHQIYIESQREDRSISYIVSRALEKYYEEKRQLKVV